jgi:hypothetical protein
MEPVRYAVSGQALFPRLSAEGRRPYDEIAERLGRDAFTVYSAIYRSPHWTRKRLDDDRELRKQVRRGSKQAADLAATVERLPKWLQGHVTVTFSATASSLHKLSRYLAWEATQGPKVDRKGGFAPAPYVLAEGMRCLFPRLRRPILLEFVGENSPPRSEFSQAVESGLKAFGIPPCWQRPARTAWKRQEAIRLRWERRYSTHGSSSSHGPDRGDNST